jgi:hypothetical protein
MGRFYPMVLAKKKYQLLAYYARYFPTVEINSIETFIVGTCNAEPRRDTITSGHR